MELLIVLVSIILLPGTLWLFYLLTRHTWLEANKTKPPTDITFFDLLLTPYYYLSKHKKVEPYCDPQEAERLVLEMARLLGLPQTPETITKIQLLWPQFSAYENKAHQLYQQIYTSQGENISILRAQDANHEKIKTNI